MDAALIVVSTVGRVAMIHARCVLRRIVVVDGRPALIFRQEFLDFPVVLLDADGKLEVLLGDRVPVLHVGLASGSSIDGPWMHVTQRGGAVGTVKDVPCRPS